MTNASTPDDAPPPELPDDDAGAVPSEVPASDASDDDAAPEPERSVPELLQELHTLVASQHAADVHGLTQMLGSKRHLFFVNFMTGVSRGVGFFLGATLIGALLIGAGAYFVDASAQVMGLKDVSTRQIVGSLYSKFHEIRSVIDDLEQKTEELGSAEEAAEELVEEAKQARDEDDSDK